MNIDRQFVWGLPSLGVFICWCALFIGLPTHAAHISEIDLGGPGSPAGQGIEFSQSDAASEHTLLVMYLSPGPTGLFGMVLDVIHLPASIGRAGVAMVTEQPWTDNTAITTTFESLDSASGSSSLPLSDTRLLVLMEGRSTLDRFNNPLSNSVANDLYKETAVTDWLVLTHGDPTAQFQNNHDIAAINATLGIDLLSRLVDKDAGRVIGRTLMPDVQPDDAIDMDTFYVGTPDDASRQFDLPDGYRYTYTPSMANLPLSHMPEPNTLALFALAAGFVLRRSRQTAAC